MRKERVQLDEYECLSLSQLLGITVSIRKACGDRLTEGIKFQKLYSSFPCPGFIGSMKSTSTILSDSQRFLEKQVPCKNIENLLNQCTTRPATGVVGILLMFILCHASINMDISFGAFTKSAESCICPPQAEQGRVWHLVLIPFHQENQDFT